MTSIDAERQLQEWAQLNEEKRQIAIRKEQMKEQLESEKVTIQLCCFLEHAMGCPQLQH